MLRLLLFGFGAMIGSWALLASRLPHEVLRELAEFVSECTKFDAEIAGEITKEKFTLAELDEEEQNLERLRRWFRDLRRRDVFVAPSQEHAERRLKDCGELLEDFAERVFAHGGER